FSCRAGSPAALLTSSPVFTRFACVKVSTARPLSSGAGARPPVVPIKFPARPVRQVWTADFAGGPLRQDAPLILCTWVHCHTRCSAVKGNLHAGHLPGAR